MATVLDYWTCQSRTARGAELKLRRLIEVDFIYRYGGALTQQFDQVIEILGGVR